MTATDVRRTLPRDGLRQAPFVLRSATAGDHGDGLSFTGYAAVFNAPTRIDSWEGCFDEQIAKGAFAKSIREQTPVMQFDHGQNPYIGSLPVGEIKSLTEDDHGLLVDARMFDDPQTGLLRKAIAAGAINGMSFRFQVVREEWRTGKGEVLTDRRDIIDALYGDSNDGPLQRTLLEVRMSELGPVVFPAYAETTASLRARQWAEEARTDPSLVRDLAEAAMLLRGIPAQRAQADDEPAAADVETASATPPGGHLAERDDAPPGGHPSESPMPDPRTSDLLAQMRSRLTQARERSRR